MEEFLKISVDSEDEIDKSEIEI